MSGCWDIPNFRNFNVIPWKGRKNEQTNEQMYSQTDERKDENYIPLGINAGGIKELGVNVFLFQF